MRRLLFVVALVALLAVTLRWQWTSLDELGEDRFEALEAQGEILVGVSWPLARTGDLVVEGLQLAADEINGGGGAGGRLIRLLVRDDGGDWDTAKAVAMEFADNEDMTAVIGYRDESVAAKAAAIYEQSRMLHIMIGVTASTLLNHGNNYSIRTLNPNDAIVRPLAELSLGLNRSTKFAMIWEEDPRGKEMANLYRIAQDARGGQLVYQRPYRAQVTDFRTVVNELKTIDADVIFYSGKSEHAGDFLRMAQHVGLKPPVVVGARSTAELVRRAGSALAGATMIDYYDVDAPSAKNRDFVARFRARFGKDPDTWSAQAYDALHLLANAVRATDSRNPLDLAYAIRFAEPWEGVNGVYRFKPNGDIEPKPFFIRQFHKDAEDRFQVGAP